MTEPKTYTLEAHLGVALTITSHQCQTPPIGDTPKPVDRPGPLTTQALRLFCAVAGLVLA